MHRCGGSSANRAGGERVAYRHLRQGPVKWTHFLTHQVGEQDASHGGHGPASVHELSLTEVLEAVGVGAQTQRVCECACRAIGLALVLNAHLLARACMMEA